MELTRILFAGSDLLLLDEPTNHLDNDAKQWLMGFLRSYRGALLVISHDLELLDASITRVLHLDEGELIEYRGTYSQYHVAARGRRGTARQTRVAPTGRDRAPRTTRRQHARPDREARQDREGHRHSCRPPRARPGDRARSASSASRCGSPIPRDPVASCSRSTASPRATADRTSSKTSRSRSSAANGSWSWG